MTKKIVHILLIFALFFLSLNITSAFREIDEVKMSIIQEKIDNIYSNLELKHGSVKSLTIF